MGNTPKPKEQDAVKDYHILTERGEVSFRDFSPDEGVSVLKMGRMEITPETSKKDAAKIMRIVEGIVCVPDQIAYNTNEITDATTTYLGPWNPTVYQTLRKYPNIKHAYESFPDKKIFMLTLETDPSIQTPTQAEAKLKEKGIQLSDYGAGILSQTKFSKEQKTYELVRFTVAQLGFSSGATTDEIYARANELGLDLCPAEVGPHLRLAYLGGEWMAIAMKQMADRDGGPDVFDLGAVDAKLLLDADGAGPSPGWYAVIQFVFLARK